MDISEEPALASCFVIASKNSSRYGRLIAVRSHSFASYMTWKSMGLGTSTMFMSFDLLDPITESGRPEEELIQHYLVTLQAHAQALASALAAYINA